jgi:hypothetical protein
MRTRNWIWVSILIFLFFCPFEKSFSQDPGIPDTIRFGKWSTYVPGPPYQGKAIAPVVVFNDYPVSYLRIILRYAGPIECDTVYFAEGRPDSFEVQNVYWDTSYVGPGIDGGIVFWGLSDPANGMPPGVGEIVWIHFQVQDTGLAELDKSVVGPEGTLFIDTTDHVYIPEVVVSQHHIVPSIPGDVNQSGETDIADAVFLINYLFIQGPPPDFMELGDVNADCQVNVADIIYLINYLFLGGPPPQFGCVF